MFGQIVARRRLLVWARMHSEVEREVIQTCGEGSYHPQAIFYCCCKFISFSSELWWMDEMQYLSGAAQSKLKIELV
jgi:hypothetical protein